jgi:predicted component of type VI protein secretion system
MLRHVSFGPPMRLSLRPDALPALQLGAAHIGQTAWLCDQLDARAPVREEPD